MPEKARRDLEEVRGRLQEAAQGGDADAGELADRVDAYLAADGPSEEDGADLLERLSLGVRKFEASHPELSRTVQGVIDSLTASGI